MYFRTIFGSLLNTAGFHQLRIEHIDRDFLLVKDTDLNAKVPKTGGSVIMSCGTSQFVHMTTQ